MLLNSRSWKSDGSVLSNNDSLVFRAVSERDRESLGHSGPWVSPFSVVPAEVSLSSSVLLSEVMGNIERAIGSTVDLWALRNDNVATLFNCNGFWVLAVSVGDVQWLHDSGPWVSENSVFGMDDLNTSVVELSHLCSDIGGAIGGSEDLNETVSDFFNARLLELDSLNWSEKESDGSSNKKLHIFNRNLINY